MAEKITFRDAHWAELFLRLLRDIGNPMVMYEGEKEAIRKGLELLLRKWDGGGAKWIEGKYQWTCSNCKEEFSFYDNAFLLYAKYCPNCGAEIGQQEDEQMIGICSKRWRNGNKRQSGGSK